MDPTGARHKPRPCTNLEGQVSEELWTKYRQLTEGEAAFRALESDLAIRPIFHRHERRLCSAAHNRLAYLEIYAYNFSTSLYASALVQFNDRTQRWSTNVRLGWLNTASTRLYAVYNDTEAFNGLGPVNRTFILKYSRQLGVLR